MFKKSVLLAMVVAGVSAFAALTKQSNLRGLNFGAPTVADRGDVDDPRRGDIILDGAGAFWGFNDGGGDGWVELNSGSVAAYRTESAVISPISGASCTVTYESNNFIASTTPNAAGDCSVTFTTAFSSSPACVVTVEGSTTGTQIQAARIANFSASGLRIITNTITSGSSTIGLNAQTVHLICHGPT